MLTFLTLSVSAATASAQTEGFRLNRFRATPTVEDGWSVEHPGTLGHLRPSVELVLDYAHEPLVLDLPSAMDGEGGAIVEHALTAHVVGALGLGDRFQLHIGLPVVLVQTGEEPSVGGVTFAEPDSPAVGDGRIGASVHAVGDDDQVFHLGLTGELLVPLGGEDALAGDDGVGVRGGVLASVATPVITTTVNLGAAYRPERDFDRVRSGSELLFGVGLEVPATDALRLQAELNGSTSLRSGQAFSKLGTPLEAVLGGRYALASGVTLGTGVGIGLTQGLGTPDVRALGLVGYAPPEEEAPGDRDGDGIVDPVDACPDEPEDADGFEDDDGCPDPDNDADGIPDAADGCPDEPEDPDGFEDGDGCPEEGPVEPEPEPEPEPELRGRLDPPVRFPYDVAKIGSSQEADLERVLAQLRRAGEEATILVEGHASDEGTEAYNRTLSRQRARAVRRWLIEHGIAPARLRIEARGATDPLVPGDGEESRRRNRRVEVHVEP